MVFLCKIVQTINMRVYLLIIFAVILVYLIIVLPFKIKAGFHVNFLNLEAYYIINFLFFNVICGKLSFDSNGINIENKSNHLFKRSDDNSSEDEYSNFLIKEYLKKVKIVNASIFKYYGNEDDAMNTALFCGVEKLFFDVVGKILSIKYEEINYYEIVSPDFCENKNTTSGYFVLKISILDVIISIFSAKLKVKRFFKESKAYGRKSN